MVTAGLFLLVGGSSWGWLKGRGTYVSPGVARACSAAFFDLEPNSSEDMIQLVIPTDAW